jgi:hypothetical protein
MALEETAPIAPDTVLSICLSYGDRVSGYTLADIVHLLGWCITLYSRDLEPFLLSAGPYLL